MGRRPTAEQCRARAARIRVLAETSDSDDERRILLDIAEGYSELARVLERKRGADHS
jgi:hypothetical protein